MEETETGMFDPLDDLDDTKEILPPAEDWREADEYLQEHLDLATYRSLRLPRKSVSMSDAHHLVRAFGKTGYFYHG
jgi:hypothetical protein